MLGRKWKCISIHGSLLSSSSNTQKVIWDLLNAEPFLHHGPAKRFLESVLIGLIFDICSSKPYSVNFPLISGLLKAVFVLRNSGETLEHYRLIKPWFWLQGFDLCRVKHGVQPPELFMYLLMKLILKRNTKVKRWTKNLGLGFNDHLFLF